MSINYPNVLGRIESALGVAAPRDDNGERALAAIEQLKIAHGVSYENGQRLARMVGEQRDTIAHLTDELEAMRQENAQHCIEAQELYTALGILGELPTHARAIEAAEAMRQERAWVSVEERLPEAGVEVFAFGCDEWSTRPRLMPAWREIGEELFRTGVHEGMCDDEVRLNATHWMPMPLRPAPDAAKGEGSTGGK